MTKVITLQASRSLLPADVFRHDDLADHAGTAQRSDDVAGDEPSVLVEQLVPLRPFWPRVCDDHWQLACRMRWRLDRQSDGLIRPLRLDNADGGKGAQSLEHLV